MIRFILEVIWVVSFLILSIPFLLILLIVGLFSKKAKANIAQAIIDFAFQVVRLISGTKLIVKGRENIPKDEAVLFVPNHRSVFDIILTYPQFGVQTGFVSKMEMRKVPIFSSWMAFMNCQFLDRKDLRKGLKVILKCADLVKNGTSICIFPEGTRNKTDEPLLPFHDGSLKIAEKSNCPIVPVALTNTENIFEAHFPKIYRKTVVIEFCKPIITKDLSKEEKKEISTKLQEVIAEAYIKNKELV